MSVNASQAQIDEAVTFLIPADGVSVEQALADAQIKGAEKIEILYDADKVARCAIITWVTQGAI